MLRIVLMIPPVVLPLYPTDGPQTKAKVASDLDGIRFPLKWLKDHLQLLTSLYPQKPTSKLLPVIDKVWTKYSPGRDWPIGA